jgi:hypothetical protein
MIEVAGTCLPVALSDVAEAIEKSRWILDLEDDWDAAGSAGYPEEIWKRAVDFLTRNATRLWQERNVRVVSPRILPGPDASIDVHWKTPGHEFLINLPGQVGEPASFYGDDGMEPAGIRSKGRSIWQRRTSGCSYGLPLRPDE